MVPLYRRAVRAMSLVSFLLTLEFDFDCLRAVVGGGDFLEPGVLEGLLGCDAVVGVVDEDAAEEVEEVGAEVVVAWYYVLRGGVSGGSRDWEGGDGGYLELFHGFDESF